MVSETLDYCLDNSFAAKEAVIKALALGVSFHDILIERPVVRVERRMGARRQTGLFTKGAPVAVVRSDNEGDNDDDDDDDDVPAQTHLVSISHDGDYSTATCLAYRADLVGSSSSRPVRENEDGAHAQTGNDKHV